MPRVHHVKKARKDNPAVKKGESYYHWQRYRSAKQYSATYPKRSQLTSSGKLAQIYDAEDSVGDCGINPETFETLLDSINNVKDTIESAGESFGEVRDEYNESADNLEEYFSGSGQIDDIREKADQCEEAADTAENIASELEALAGRLDDLGDKPTHDDTAADMGIEDDEDEDDYDDRVNEAHDDACDEWQSEFDDIANDAENEYGNFEGPML